VGFSVLSKKNEVEISAKKDVVRLSERLEKKKRMFKKEIFKRLVGMPKKKI
jgi:hypothetical protein